MMTDSMGQLVNQTMGSNPNDRAIQANSPESGFIRRFFHTSALTVGMTKNGAMTMSRRTFSPNTGWSISKATRMPPHNADDEHGDDKDQRIEKRSQEIRIGEE